MFYTKVKIGETASICTEIDSSTGALNGQSSLPKKTKTFFIVSTSATNSQEGVSI